MNMGNALDAKAGSAVAASKSEAMFGLPGKSVLGSAGSGTAVYFNEKTNFTQEINDPLSGTNDLFGSSLAIGKKFMVVGAPRDYLSGGPLERSGAAFVANKKDFLPNVLSGHEVHDFDQIGAAVAVSNKFIAVGAPGYSGGTGAVHIFNAKTRAFVTTLTIGGTLFNLPHFGSSLVFSGKYLFVGAPNDDFGLFGFPGYEGAAGSVIQYDTKAWTIVRTLRAPSIEGSAEFGASLSADKKRIAVGSPGTATAGIERGSAFLYDIKTGDFQETFVSAEPIDHEEFGRSVLLTAPNLLAVGAPATEVDSREGNVYVFTLSN
jgi:hypothetical protein